LEGKGEAEVLDRALHTNVGVWRRQEQSRGSLGTAVNEIIM